MSEGNPYNGYTWAERQKKFDVAKLGSKSGVPKEPEGPCSLCGDPDVEVEYHDEDYSLPYIWDVPAAYVVCHHCHVHKIHTRFIRPTAWQAFLAHVRRGGYARDLKDPAIKKEFDACNEAIKKGQTFELVALRPYTQTIGQEWFARLNLDPASLTDPKARPRS